MALKNNTWKLNQWYDQSVAGNISYSGSPELWAWGYNDKGALAQNDREYYSSPRQIPGTTWSTMMVTSPNQQQEQACIRTDGTLWVWGNNANGQLGLNNRTEYSSPTQVPGSTLAAVKSIKDAFLATKTDGTMWAWGSNTYGELGLNNRTEYSSPVQLPGTWSTDPKKLGGAPGSRAFAIKSDGTMWGWGDGNYGRLGLNDYPASGPRRRSSPTQITTATNWSHISDGTYGTLALNTDGEIFGWGDNADYGTLGLNDLANRSSPTQIPGTTWSWISSAYNAKYAVRSDGTAWSWGNNTYGQLGVNDKTKYSSPTQIGSDTNWSKFGLNGGYGYIHAIKTDNTLWAWGSGAYGRLGMNNQNQYSSPIQIPGSWTNVSGSMRSAHALRSV